MTDEHTVINVESYVSKARGYDYWKERYEREYVFYQKSEGLQWGLTILQERIKLYGKKLVFVMARSKFGKSSFAAHMARANIKKGKKILIFSCEEAGEYFTSRFSNANFYNTLNKEMMSNYYLVDESQISLDDIRNEARLIKPDIIFVDQLNKISLSGQKFSSKHDRIVFVSEALQGIVKETGVPLVVLHQLNRDTAVHKGLYNQSHVSDADAVYNEAQIAIFLQSKDYCQWEREGKLDEPERRIFTYEINISKNRSFGGWEGLVEAKFDRETGHWFDSDPFTLEDYEAKKKGWSK